MPSLVESVGNFVASIFHAITSALGGVLAIFQSLINAILGVFGTFLDAIGTSVKGLANTFSGLLTFLLSTLQHFLTLARIPPVGRSDQILIIGHVGNIVVIVGLVAAVFLFSLYQGRNGRPVAGNKKTI